MDVNPIRQDFVDSAAHGITRCFFPVLQYSFAVPVSHHHVCTLPLALYFSEQPVNGHQIQQ